MPVTFNDMEHRGEAAVCRWPPRQGSQYRTRSQQCNSTRGATSHALNLPPLERCGDTTTEGHSVQRTGTGTVVAPEGRSASRKAARYRQLAWENSMQRSDELAAKNDAR